MRIFHYAHRMRPLCGDTSNLVTIDKAEVDCSRCKAILSDDDQRRGLPFSVTENDPPRMSDSFQRQMDSLVSDKLDGTTETPPYLGNDLPDTSPPDFGGSDNGFGGGGASGTFE